MSLLALLLACAPDSPPPAPAPAAPEPAPAEPAPEAVDLSPSTDPFVLATRLATAEERILDPLVSDADAARWGHAQQRVLRTLADDPVLAARTLESLPPAARPRAERLLGAVRDIARTAPPRTDLPDWKIVAPRPAAELEALYRAGSAAHGVPWTVLAAIHLHETRMGRLRGASPVGARGPMQFMPQTWKDYGEGDIEDDGDAIRAAAKYLAASGWAKDPEKAVWAYNHSKAYVSAVLEVARTLDEEPRLLRGLWGWQVYYRTVQGAIWLGEGYASDARQPIEAYCTTSDELHCPKIH